MTTTPFAIGDVVRLKSGGPAMTMVGFYAEDGEQPYHECMWFADDGSFGNQSLPVAALVLASLPVAAAPSGDIVVTEAMLEAGYDAWFAEGCPPDYDAKSAVRVIYRAMETERRRGAQP